MTGWLRDIRPISQQALSAVASRRRGNRGAG